MNDTRNIWRAILWLAAACISSVALAAPQTAGGLPSYQAVSSAPLPTVNPFDPSSGLGAGGGLRACPHVCLVVNEGQSAEDAIDQFQRNNHCVVGADDGQDEGVGEDKACTEKWREDESFLQVSEGALITKGYVPTYTRDIKDKNGKVIHKKGEAIGASGVTISTGVDLGQQSNSGTKSILNNYVAEKGNAANVDIDALVKKLDPYFAPTRKQEAIDALAKTPLTVTQEEARLLADAFAFDTQNKVARQFDKNNTEGMVFKKLPEEAQTVIIDFAYQYGLSSTSGDVRKNFWKYVYAGDWKDLATWLKGNPDQYTSRRKREGDRLQAALDSKGLPDSGDPCAPSDATGDAAPNP